MDNLPEEVEQHYYKNKELVSNFKYFDSPVRPTINVYRSDKLLDRWACVDDDWKLVLEGQYHLTESDVRSDKVTIVDFRYFRGNNDDEPKIIYLGTWEREDKNLVCGINLNYLTEEQEQDLKSRIGLALLQPTVQGRVEILRSFLADLEIFEIAYRTYDDRYIRIKEIVEEDIVSF